MAFNAMLKRVTHKNPLQHYHWQRTLPYRMSMSFIWLVIKKVLWETQLKRPFRFFYNISTTFWGDFSHSTQLYSNIALHIFAKGHCSYRTSTELILSSMDGFRTSSANTTDMEWRLMVTYHISFFLTRRITAWVYRVSSVECGMYPPWIWGDPCTWLLGYSSCSYFSVTWPLQLAAIHVERPPCF